jgi:hypothetical protein
VRRSSATCPASRRTSSASTACGSRTGPTCGCWAAARPLRDAPAPPTASPAP